MATYASPTSRGSPGLPPAESSTTSPTNTGACRRQRRPIEAQNSSCGIQLSSKECSCNRPDECSCSFNKNSSSATGEHRASEDSRGTSLSSASDEIVIIPSRSQRGASSRSVAAGATHVRHRTERRSRSCASTNSRDERSIKTKQSRRRAPKRRMYGWECNSDRSRSSSWYSSNSRTKCRRRPRSPSIHGYQRKGRGSISRNRSRSNSKDNRTARSSSGSRSISIRRSTRRLSSGRRSGSWRSHRSRRDNRRSSPSCSNESPSRQSPPPERANPLFAAHDPSAYTLNTRRHRRRSRSPRSWTHDRFAIRSLSPQRRRPQAPMWDTRLGQWKSRAGGVYIPPTPEELQAAEGFQRTFREKEQQTRSTSAISGCPSSHRQRSPSLERRYERGSPVYE